MGGRIRRLAVELPPELALLKSELELAHVRLPEVGQVDEATLLAELAYALSPPIHEERQPTMGSSARLPMGLVSSAFERWWMSLLSYRRRVRLQTASRLFCSS